MGMLDPHNRLLLVLSFLLATALLLWALSDPVAMLEELLERAGTGLL